MSNATPAGAPEPSLAVRVRWWFSGLWYRARCATGFRPKSNLEIHAERELRLAGWFDEDGMYGGMMGPAVMSLVSRFCDEGHSGMSAGLAIGLFKKVAAYEPLTPLTGDDDEWMAIAEYMAGRPDLFQNKRCGRVFKDGDGAYDIDGRVFREPNGACFTSSDSRVAVEFPYTPTTEYVDVDSNGGASVSASSDPPNNNQQEK